jgi:hypothetical protein
MRYAACPMDAPIALRDAPTRRDDPRHQMGDYWRKLVLVGRRAYILLPWTNV